jgi:hypothetical protein
MQTIIIHKHNTGCGGIGDFLRSALSFYSLAIRCRYGFCIDLSDNPHLQQCFITPPISTHVNMKNAETIRLLRGIYSIDDMKCVLEKFKNQPAVYVLYSNAIGFEKIEDLHAIIPHFFSTIIKPSQLVIDYLNNIYATYGLQKNNYISVHVRCGDRNMCKRSNPTVWGDGDNPNRRDFRIDVGDADVPNRYNNLIQTFIKKQDIDANVPIVIHSDSSVFKQKLHAVNPNYKIIDIEIQHIAENIGNNNLDSYVSTIAELYMIANASKIFMPNVYSGFSHLASLINQIPLYVNMNSCYFDYYNANNIVKIK